MSGLIRLFRARWREKLLWTATGASWASVIACLADRATTREFTVAVLVTASLTPFTLQDRLVARRVDRIFRAEREADRRWLMRQRGRATGPQLAVVEGDRTRS